MGFLKRLLGGDAQDRPPPAPPSEPSGRPSWMRPGSSVQVTLCEGREPLGVVGESHYQAELWRIVGVPEGTEVLHEVHGILVPEDDNPHDPNTVSVWVSGLRVGYLSRDVALTYRRGLLALIRREGQPIALAGVIAGGGPGDDGRPRMLGVFLHHAPTDFGLPDPHPDRGPRTGLSAAFATDEEDDSYDLSWQNDLPDDAPRRVPKLRALLDKDPHPIDRHYMFTMLEADLYACRDAFPSALAEFDEVCERHHTEMAAGIRAALLRKLGVIPLLDLYRQAAVRQQKAHDYAAALQWAVRGLDVYGTEAGRPEWVDDLTRRAEHYRAKLALPTHRPKAPPKPRPPRPEGPPSPPATQELQCSTCGRQWQRPAVRGRPPAQCPECTGKAARRPEA